MTDTECYDGLPPQLDTLLTTWSGLGKPGSAPTFQAFEAQVSWHNHLALIGCEPGGYRIRNCGVGLIRRFGREATGEWISNLAPDIAAGLNEALDKAAGEGGPVICHPHVGFGSDTADAIDLIMPLMDVTGGAVFLFASYEVVV